MDLAPLWAEGPTIVAHTGLALAALGLSAVQLVRPKGGAAHRALGYLWAAAMMGVALTSFWIHEIRLWGPWSPIHLLSVLVLVATPAAVWAARAGRRRAHRAAMLQLTLFALLITGAFTLLPGRALHAVVFGG